MTEADALTQAAARLRGDGYDVTISPPPEALPDVLRREYPALVARRNGKAVFVEVWTRGQLHAAPPDDLPTGWEYEAVLTPGGERTTPPGPAPTAEFTAGLLTELERYVPPAAHQSRFLLAWSAAESAMRVAAVREDLDADRLPLRQLMSELVAAGLLPTEHADALAALMTVRNRLAHGVPVDPVGEESVSLLVRTAKELLAPTPAAA